MKVCKCKHTFYLECVLNGHRVALQDYQIRRNNKAVRINTTAFHSFVNAKSLDQKK